MTSPLGQGLSFGGFNQTKVRPLQFIFGKALEAAGQVMSGTQNQYTNNIQQLAMLGATANTHQAQGTQYGTSLQQLGGFMNGSQAVTNAGSAQLLAAQMRMQQIVAAATAQGYQVLPTGMVIPGAAHLASANPHIYWARARAYTAQINATLAQANTLDQQIASALIKVMTDTLGSFLQKKINGESGSSTTLPTTTLPGTTVPTTSTGTTIPTTFPAIGSTTSPTSIPLTGGLASVSTLGAGAGVDGLGARGLTGVTGGAGAVSLAGGAGGAAGALGLGGMPAAGGGVAGGRPMAGGMMPMAGGAGAARGGGGQEHAASTWLNEDEDPWSADEAPSGVVA